MLRNRYKQFRDSFEKRAEISVRMKRLGVFVNVSKILTVSALDLTGGLRPLSQWLRHQGIVRTARRDRSAGEQRGDGEAIPLRLVGLGPPGSRVETSRDTYSNSTGLLSWLTR